MTGLNQPFTDAVLVFSVSAHRWLPVTTYKLNSGLAPNSLQKHARRAKRTARPQKKLHEDVQTWGSYIDSPLIFHTSSHFKHFLQTNFSLSGDIWGFAWVTSTSQQNHQMSPGSSLWLCIDFRAWCLQHMTHSAWDASTFKLVPPDTRCWHGISGLVAAPLPGQQHKLQQTRIERNLA